MIKKKFFKKKSINLKKYVFLSLFFLLLAFLILLFTNLKQQFFNVPQFIGSFYIIPDSKGGKEVMNLDKKSLHFNNKKIQETKIINDPFLEYSIQIFSSSDYNLVKERLDFITNQNIYLIKNLPLKISDLFIVVFHSDLYLESFLLRFYIISCI